MSSVTANIGINIILINSSVISQGANQNNAEIFLFLPFKLQILRKTQFVIWKSFYLEKSKNTDISYRLSQIIQQNLRSA